MPAGPATRRGSRRLPGRSHDRSTPVRRPAGSASQAGPDPGECRGDLGVDVARTDTDEAAAGLDVGVVDDGDAGVGDELLDLVDADPAVGVDAHHQVVALRGEGERPDDGVPIRGVAQRGLPTDEDLEQLEGEADDVGHELVDDRGPLFTDAAAAAASRSAARVAAASRAALGREWQPPRARPGTRRRSPPGGPAPDGCSVEVGTTGHSADRSGRPGQQRRRTATGRPAGR